MRARAASVAGASVFVVALATASEAIAQKVQTVNIQVSAISVMSLAAGTPSLIVSTAVAGVDPSPATATSQYNVTTNQLNQKITAHVNLTLPAGITLAASLAPPTGATGAGSVVLGTTDVNLVTGIATLAAQNLGLTYTLAATAAAGTLAATTRQVTYTITTGP
jgi:hypothetical protein